MPTIRRVAFVSLLLGFFILAASGDPLVLTFAGDIMHHDTNAAMAEYDRLYDAVRPFLATDSLSFANIEFPVDPTLPPAGYPIFNGSPEYVDAAIRGGFEVFSLANNHSFDLRERGVSATAAQFALIHEETATFSNGLRSEPGAEITPTVIEHDGWSIAFVAVTSFSNEPGSHRFINLVDYANESARERFLGQVAAWDLQHDLVIVSVHAGIEYTGTADPRKARFFRELIDRGADIVWGHHPHVLQEWETVDVGTSTKLIMYSTGNLVSGQRSRQQPFLPLGRWAATGDAALYRVTVTRAAVPGGDGRLQPTLSRVETPMFTTYQDPRHGLVLRTFGDVLGERLPLSWRAFFVTRYAATRATLAARHSSVQFRRLVLRPE